MKTEFVCPKCGNTFEDYLSRNRTHCSYKCAHMSYEKDLQDVLLDIILYEPTTLDTGCWKYPNLNSKGYGRIELKGNNTTTHKLLYEYFVGSITNNLNIHHTCGNKWCCNFEHLKLVSSSEHRKLHMLDPKSIQNIRRQRTHCLHGHKYTPENTRITPKGQRCCKICVNRSTRLYIEKQNANRNRTS